jgi:hypothetical protein
VFAVPIKSSYMKVEQIYTDFANVFFMFSHNSILLMFIYRTQSAVLYKGQISYAHFKERGCNLFNCSNEELQLI